MKKIILITSIMAIVAGVFYSCTKEIDESPTTTLESGEDIISVVHFTSTKGDITMLEFSSTEHFDATMVDLENQVITHFNDFQSQYQNLEGDALMDQMNASEFLEIQPLLNFENNYSFDNSLRKKYDIVMNNWLSNEILDFKNDPSPDYIFDEEMMTLLNEEGEVKIGNSIFSFSPRGMVEIIDGDVPTLIRVRENDPTVYDEDNVITDIEGGGKDNCKTWSTGYWWDNYATNKKVKLKVAFHRYSYKVVYKAKIKSYKYRYHWLYGWGWRSYSTYLKAKVYADTYNNDCEYETYMSTGYNTGTSTSKKQDYTVWGSWVPLKHKPWHTAGTFYYAGKTTTKWLQ